MSFLEVPQTQSTAPVFEHRCLFTSDLRRKQKRWQDGHLKFHKFNNRVMVYDDRSNFVGDTHWREDELNEGEELELERRGILVEVGERTGQRNQDVSDLVDKPRKEKEDRAAARAAAAPAPREHGTPSGSEFLRPKPLNQMLTPLGRHGRAVIPNVSPFEEKEAQNRPTDENERPAKRRKTEDTSSKSGYAQNLVGASLNLSSSRPPSTATIRYEPLKLKSAPVRKPAATIDLTSESDNDRRVGVRQDGARAVERSRQQNSGVQKRNKRSPITKSGYASSLTGAALSLSRHTEVTPTRTSKALIARKSPTPMEMDDQHSGFTEEDASMIDSSASDRSAAAAKSRKSASDKNDKSLSLKAIFDSRPSSPATVERGPFTVTRTSAAKGTTPRSPQGRPRKTQQPQSKKSAAENGSSSPYPMVSSRKPSIETGPSRQTAIPNSSLDEPNSAKATSSLRIKSRPPRKMMMLMERPSSRQNMVSSSDRMSSKSKNSLKLVANEMVLSQATLQLDYFRQKQEERRQARLNGQRSNIGFDDLSDSPPDSGINHQTIDLLLSRKSNTGETKVKDTPERATESSELASKAKKSHFINLGKQQKSCLLDLVEDEQSLLKTLVSSHMTSKTSVDKDLGQSCQTVLKENRSINGLSRTEDVAFPVTDAINEMSIDSGLLSGTTNSNPPNIPEALSTAQISSLSNFPIRRAVGDEHLPADTLDISYVGNTIALPDKDVSLPSQKLQNGSLSHADLLLDQINAVAPKTRTDPAALLTGHTINQIPNERILSENQTNSRKGWSKVLAEEQRDRTSHLEDPKAEELPRHKPSAIEGTMEHTRARMDPSTGQQEGIPVPAVPVRNIGRIKEPSTGPISPSEAGPVSSRLVIKSSPKPTPVELNIPGGRESLQNGDIIHLKRDPGPPLPQAEFGMALDNTERFPSPPPPRAKVTNPATRGKSLQSIAANTADALAPTFNAVMLPPAPRQLNRINKTNPRVDITGVQAEAAPVRELCQSGPWSRESFDLFGAWKPPERNAGTNVAAA